MASLALDSWNLNHFASIVLEIQINITAIRAVSADQISSLHRLVVMSFVSSLFIM